MWKINREDYHCLLPKQNPTTETQRHRENLPICRSQGFSIL